MYQDVVDYYAGLIEFRRNHPALRMTTAGEVSEKITQLGGLDFNVLGFHIARDANGEENALVVLFNPNAEATTVTLPEGVWDIRINAETAGDSSLGSAEGTVEVAPISAMVLVQEAEKPVVPTEPVAAEPVPKGNDSMWIVCAVVILIALIGCGILFRKKK